MNGGFIDKFIGDAIMALFVDDDDPATAAQNAVRTALDMLSALEVFNRKRVQEQHDSVSIGIGIHTGEAVLGTVGSADRMDSTVLGDAVNLASRIEALTKKYGVQVLVSSSTQKCIENVEAIRCCEIGEVKVRGREETDTVFEILS